MLNCYEEGGGRVAYKILVSAPFPLGLIGPLNLFGLGWGFGLRVLGLTMSSHESLLAELTLSREAATKLEPVMWMPPITQLVCGAGWAEDLRLMTPRLPEIRSS